MKQIPDARLKKARIRSGRYSSDDSFGNTGAFHLTGPNGKLLVIASDGLTADGTVMEDWEHVSVSPYRKKRIPTWEEMCFIKDIFWDPEETVIQCQPDTPRKTVTPKQTLSDIRSTLDKYIKNSYMKKVQAPVGTQSTLLAWMELV